MPPSTKTAPIAPASSAAPTLPTAPPAPQHLSEAAANKWQDRYVTTLMQAKRDYPKNEMMQRSLALKAANAILSVPAPDSAAAIDKLEEWQFILRETRTIKNCKYRLCVTSDGRKYKFPISTQAPAPPAKPTTPAGPTTSAAS